MENERASQAGDGLTSGGGGGLMPLVLASASPRRAEILRAVGWPFEMRPADIDESLRPAERAPDYVRRLALTKAETVAAMRLFGVVLGADTVVVADGEILGKPRDDGEARRMLRGLSGKWHEVLTGVALARAEDGERRVAHERTRVRFAEMSEREIAQYVATGEPLDKAGAYAVQGGAALFVEAIEGDYWNVVGLPVRLVYQLTRDF